jgi:hypothetical protein
MFLLLLGIDDDEGVDGVNREALLELVEVVSSGPAAVDVGLSRAKQRVHDRGRSDLANERVACMV